MWDRGERRAMARAEAHGAILKTFLGDSGAEAWGVVRWRHHPVDAQGQYMGSEFAVT